MKKDVEKFINNIVDQLPIIFDYIITPNVEITGEDIHLSGLDSTDVENSDRIYYISMPFYYPINHKRRLKKAFKSNGVDGMRNYINKISKLQ